MNNEFLEPENKPINNTFTSLSYQDSLNKIILTFPIYYKIFQSYYNEGTNVSDQLNRLYHPIFTGLLEYYSEFMTNGINQIIESIQNQYKPDKSYAIIDYIEFIFGNILYETFLSEIKKINSKSIGYEHLCVFEYIIRVEIIKYNLYLNTISKIEPGSKILLAMEYRLTNCLKKISFSMCYLEKNFSSHSNIIDLCKKLILDAGLDNKIDQDITNQINSFMQINKKNY